MAIRGIGMSFSAPSTRRPILSPNPRFLSASSTIPLFLVPSRSSYLLLSFSFSRPETECPVPHEQQPINEYQSLSTSFPFSWAAGDVVEYASRLFVTGASFALLLGLPVAWFGSAGAQAEPAKRLLCAASSGLFAVTLAVVRMYLGWAYVGNRLLSATVEYEETGWYDGQVCSPPTPHILTFKIWAQYLGEDC
ncbi:hypothetical protein AAZX31_14G094100 [Glycine max]